MTQNHSAILGSHLPSLLLATKLATETPSEACLVVLETSQDPAARLKVGSLSLGQPCPDFPSFHDWCLSQELPSFDQAALADDGRFFFTNFALSAYFDQLWEAVSDRQVYRVSPQDWHQRADGFVEFLLNEQSLIVDPINLVGPEAKSEGCFPVSPGVQIFQNMAETAFASALDSALTVALIGSDRQGLSQGLQALEASGFDGEMVLISEHPVGQISLPMNARAIHGQVLNIGRLMSHTADIEIKPPSGQNRSVLADVVIVAQ